MSLDKIIKNKLDDILKDYNKIDGVRESLIKLGRELLNKSIMANRYITKGELDKGKKFLLEAKNIYFEAENLLNNVSVEPSKCILYRVLFDGLRELVESILLYNRLSDEDFLLDIFNKIPNSVFVEGLFDYTGELRRKILEFILEGKLDEAKSLISEIKYIYETLSMFTVKSYYIHDFRRRLDLLRGSLLRSMEDLSNAIYSKRADTR